MTDMVEQIEETDLLVKLRAKVRGNASARVTRLHEGSRPVVLVEVKPTDRQGALSYEDSSTIAQAGRMALTQRMPLVIVLASSGADITEGVAALDGWGRAAQALSACSGIVPVILVAYGLALSGPALLLGMADVVIMTSDATAYVSGPGAVEQVTGQRVGPSELGGSTVHARSTGVSALEAADIEEAMELAAELLEYLPSHTDELPPHWPNEDPWQRSAPELRDLVPPSPTGSYDVKKLIEAVADDGVMLQLRASWAPQLVTALIRVDGQSVGVIANQPQVMAGTLDIAASQKGARFVSFCDSFNIPLLTIVDTPGFMPGKDLEWRGMIRHGAQLVYAYAEATVPRVCLVVRKAFGGAYIVMDSKAMGNDICLAWPSAQLAVMGAEGAIQILHRRATPEEQAALVEEYKQTLLNPYVAAERGYVDEIIDPADTRTSIARTLKAFGSKRERLVRRKHGNSPL